MEAMERHVAFPFVGERFPEILGALIQRTVLDARLPALYVAHTSENDWIVGDGINDPNVPEAAAAAHIRHVVDLDATLEPLATLPLCFQAVRASIDSLWEIEPMAWLGDDQPFTRQGA
jgi:hypothetical protein